jgi:hypothetical protein
MVAQFIDEHYDVNFFIASLACIVGAAGCGLLFKKRKKGLLFGFGGILVVIIASITDDFFQRRLKNNHSDVKLVIVLCYIIPIIIGLIMTVLANKCIENKLQNK